MGVQLPSEPLTRKEQYLAKAAGQAVEVPAEPITREEAYLAAIAEGSGGGGTNDYNQLKNQPQIGGNTLVGNKTASDLGLVAAETGKGLSTNDYTNTDKGIVEGVPAAIAGKQDKYETITYAQWQAMTPAQQAEKDYYISDYPSSVLTAGNIAYDNTSSGMAANKVQGAIDELKSDLNNLIKYQDVTVTGEISLTAGIPKYIAYTSSISDGQKIIGVKLLSAEGETSIDGNVGAYLALNNFIHLLSTANKSFTSITFRLFYI